MTNSLAAAFKIAGRMGPREGASETAPEHAKNAAADIHSRPLFVRNTFGKAQVGDPVFDSAGKKVGHVSAADALALHLAIDGAVSAMRITRAFIEADRDAIRPSKKTIAAIPGLRDEIFFLNRNRQR